MGLRFRRRIRLMPGVHLNLGKAGMSLSVGMRGASITAGARGIYGNVGATGTGLSFRSKLFGKKAAPTPSPSAFDAELNNITFNVILRLKDDGQVIIEGDDGRSLTPRQLKLLRDQKGDFVEQWINEQIDKFNSDYYACMNVHALTPSLADPVWRRLPIHNEPQPTPPNLKAIKLIDRLLWRRRRIELENGEAQSEYHLRVIDWKKRDSAYRQIMSDWKAIFDSISAGDTDTMESVLSYVLKDIPWPRETEVQFDFAEDASTAALDIDFPEIESMPDRIATAAGRGFRVNFKPRSDSQIRADYTRFLHGIAFRVVGEAFSNLPTISQVTVSGYTQRPDPQTGHIRNEYVLSARVHWADWSQINFENLNEVDPIEALSRFEVVRSLDRKGALQVIQPLF